MKFAKEFREFISRGNVLNLAVAVIIGGAFQAIINSLVNDIIMPFVSMLTGGIDFSQWKWVLKAADEATETAEVAVNFGNLITVVLDFIIIAFVIFSLIKAMNKLKKKEEEKPAEPEAPAGPTTEELLTEIRDLLKEQK